MGGSRDGTIRLPSARTMKTTRIVAVLACLVLPSCYEFDFPLDPKPQVPVDARLIGTWRCLGAEPAIDDAPATLLVERRTAALAHWSFEVASNDGTMEKDDYDVHGSTVRGGALLNVFQLGEKASGKWNFVRYTFVAPEILRLQFVDDEPFVKVKGSAVDLRKAIEKRRNDAGIYKDYCICVRVKATPSPSPTPAS